MYLRHDSIIQEINEGCSDIPSDRFYFKTFDQLPSLVNNIKYLTDVIGIVRNISGISTIRKKIIQLLKKWISSCSIRGKWYLSSTYSTKLIFNSEIDEAHQLQTWYAEHKDLHSAILANPSNEKRGTIMEWKNYKQDTHKSVCRT
ncbi:hypothetical protein AAC387_Pa11g1839 [Persea americana]